MSTLVCAAQGVQRNGLVLTVKVYMEYYAFDFFHKAQESTEYECSHIDVYG